jgi:hypothetical protein
MKEITLQDGTVVRTRLVPPYAYGVIHKHIPEPEYPTVKLQSASGGVEEAPALQESPEWQEYQKKWKQYRRQVGEATIDFSLAYGILGWRRPNQEKFHNEVPADWEIDPILQDYGLHTAKTKSERRIQFIRYELLTTEEDVAAVEVAIGIKDEIVSKEVEDALTPFDSEEG